MTLKINILLLHCVVFEVVMSILKELQGGKHYYQYFFIPKIQHFSFRTLDYAMKTIPDIIKECSVIMCIIYFV